MNYFWQRFVVSVFLHCLCLYRIIRIRWPVSHPNIGRDYSLDWSQNLYMLVLEQVLGHDTKIRVFTLQYTTRLYRADIRSVLVLTIYRGRFTWTCTCSNLKLNFIWYPITDPNLFFHTRSSPRTHVQVVIRVLWFEASSSMQNMQYWINNEYVEEM